MNSSSDSSWIRLYKNKAYGGKMKKFLMMVTKGLSDKMVELTEDALRMSLNNRSETECVCKQKLVDKTCPDCTGRASSRVGIKVTSYNAQIAIR